MNRHLQTLKEGGSNGPVQEIWQCHCVDHTFPFQISPQAVYLEFCVCRVLAGNRWPTATEMKFKTEAIYRTQVGVREARGTVQFRGPRWEAMTTPGPEEQGPGVEPAPQEAAARRGLPGMSCSPRCRVLHCRGQFPTESGPLVCPAEFVYLHCSFSEVSQFGQ